MQPPALVGFYPAAAASGRASSRSASVPIDNILIFDLVGGGGGASLRRPKVIPAPPHIIESLPKRKFQTPKAQAKDGKDGKDAGAKLDSKESKDGKEEYQCTFCLEQFQEGEWVRTLPCFHQFHQQEIDKWLLTNGTCPVCKHSVMDAR
jgi:hypothetical protein